MISTSCPLVCSTSASRQPAIRAPQLKVGITIELLIEIFSFATVNRRGRACDATQDTANEETRNGLQRIWECGFSGDPARDSRPTNIHSGQLCLPAFER